MTVINYRRVWLSVYMMLICAGVPLSGQSELNPIFISEVSRSLIAIERFQSNKHYRFNAYLTFHPVSQDDEAVSMYVSITFHNNEGKRVVDSGNFFQVSSNLLPEEPLQLIVQPVVIYLNFSKIDRMNSKPDNKFPEREISDWESCGYKVKKPTEIRWSRRSH